MKCVKRRMIDFFNRKSIMLDTRRITQIQNLAKKKLPKKRIAKRVGVSLNTVKKYMNGTPERKQRPKSKPRLFLQEHIEDIRQYFFNGKKNCAVVQQRIEEKYGILINLRMIQRFCVRFREEGKEATHTLRFETPPGQQEQIDFGEMDVEIIGKMVRIHLFVGILSHSRDIFPKAYFSENQDTWLDGIESSFQFWDGIPLEVVSDNTRCLVRKNGGKQSVEFTEAYKHLSEYWGFRPVACQPGKPQSKGKVERAVQYVKDNALAGQSFSSLEELNTYLRKWARRVAGKRRLNGNIPGLRTPEERLKEDKAELQPFDKPRIANVWQETRKVDAKGLVRVNNRFYRVPDRLISQEVEVQVLEDSIIISRAGIEQVKLDPENFMQVQMQDHSRKPCESPKDYPEYQNNPYQRGFEEYADFMNEIIKVMSCRQ